MNAAKKGDRISDSFSFLWKAEWGVICSQSGARWVIKCLLKIEKSWNPHYTKGDQRRQIELLGYAEGSAVVGQWEFKVFPNFPVFWFPPTVLSCAGASTKKINPSGVNREWGRRPLIYKKDNGSKGLATWSHLVWKKTVQHTSAGTKSFSVLVWRATTELTTWEGQQAHNWCQFSHLLAVWSLANYLISPCLRFCFC